MDDMEEFEFDDGEFGDNFSALRMSNITNTTDSLSDNISLFQSIHVLQSKEDDEEPRNDTTAGNEEKYLVTKLSLNKKVSKLVKNDISKQLNQFSLFIEYLSDDEDTICIQSIVFAAVIGNI